MSSCKSKQLENSCPKNVPAETEKESESLGISASIFFPADFQVSIKRARGRGNDIAAQNTKLLSPVMKLSRFEFY